MTDQFRDSFVGEKGYENLKQSIKTSHDVSAEIARCFLERHGASVVYIRSLRKTSEALRKISSCAIGSMGTALEMIATQTENEAKAHETLAQCAFKEIFTSLRTINEANAKEKKTMEDAMNSKMKAWKEELAAEDSLRNRQFERSNDIEELHLKLAGANQNSIPSRESAKESISPKASMISCILPTERYSNRSEKLNNSIRKLEQELTEVEQKYHDATIRVELARQSFDKGLVQFCDDIQKMEKSRINNTKRLFESYGNSMVTFAESMNRISRDLNNIRIWVEEDCISTIKANVYPAENEILLYDIYAENDRNSMDRNRRLMSLQRWMEILQRDLKNNQRQSAKTHSSVPDDDDDDDDEDGAMRRRKDKRKGNETPKSKTKLSFSFGTNFFEVLYGASLYKMEKVFNYYQNKPAPQSNFAQYLTKSCNKKGNPTTFVRLPIKNNEDVPPSAPYDARAAVEAFPCFFAIPAQSMIVPVVADAPQSRKMTRNMDLDQAQPSVREQRMVQNAPIAYPVLPTATSLAQSGPPVAQTPKPRLYKALYQYKAEHPDELSFEPDDLIVLIDCRDDGWCVGILNKVQGLFPRNYVKECS